ncbi:MAG: RNA methyltransferase [Pseudomonadota bacterium]
MKRISRSEAAAHVRPAPVFVLVEPQMGENIGAAARAMLNFGVSGLRLVNPRDGWPNPKATAMASGAASVIDGAQVFSTLDAAIADCQFVVATTARMRELATPMLEPEAALKRVSEKIAMGDRVAILFGGERNGLSSDDVARADVILSVPTNPAFASINLAQAALLVAYEWARVRPFADEAAETAANRRPQDAPAARADVDRLYQHLETALDARGYFFPVEMRGVMTRNLRAAFVRAGFSESEVRTLHGVFKSLSRKGDEA